VSGGRGPADLVWRFTELCQSSATPAAAWVFRRGLCGGGSWC